jgi:hypothetical protein
MTSLQIPCANSECSNPRRETSIYCSICCQRAVARKLFLERHPEKAYQRVGHKPNRAPKFNYSAPRRSVTVTDPLVATPYTISRAEFDRYAPDYRALGCSAEIDGQELLI